MLVFGIISLVIGALITYYGFALNSDPSARLASLIASGNTNPGLPFIVIGVVLIVIGIVLLILRFSKK